MQTLNYPENHYMEYNSDFVSLFIQSYNNCNYCKSSTKIMICEGFAEVSVSSAGSAAGIYSNTITACTSLSLIHGSPDIPLILSKLCMILTSPSGSRGAGLSINTRLLILRKRRCGYSHYPCPALVFPLMTGQNGGDHYDSTACLAICWLVQSGICNAKCF